MMRLASLVVLVILAAGCGKSRGPAPAIPPPPAAASTPEGACRAAHEFMARREGLAFWDALHSESRMSLSKPNAALFEAAKQSPDASANMAALLAISVDQFKALSVEEFAKKVFAKTFANPRNDTDGRNDVITAKWDAAEIRGDRAEIHGRTPGGVELWEAYQREGSDWKLNLTESDKLAEAKAALRPVVEPAVSPEKAWDEFRAVLLKSDVRSAVLIVSAQSKEQLMGRIHEKFVGFQFLPDAEQKELASQVGLSLEDFRVMTLKEYAYKLLSKIFTGMCAIQEFRDELARFNRSSSKRNGSSVIVTAEGDGDLKPAKWVFLIEKGEWKLDLFTSMRLQDSGK